MNLNETYSIIEVNDLIENCSDEVLNEILNHSRFIPKYIKNLSKKAKEKIHKQNVKDVKDSVDKIIDIMKKGNYENL